MRPRTAQGQGVGFCPLRWRWAGCSHVHLLAIDHPVVAVAHRACGEAGQITAGSGLTEQLAPDFLARP
jgi:hypothetical protein